MHTVIIRTSIHVHVIQIDLLCLVREILARKEWCIWSPNKDIKTSQEETYESSIKEDEDQRGLIITDDIAIHPILDFNLYTNAIVEIIKNSYPKFTIGIFGDWGTGKTTLMNSIHKTLQNDNSTHPIRFETWRYEQEDQFALIPLLKTIAFALPDEEQFQSLKQKLKRGAFNLTKKAPDIVSSIVSRYVGEDVGKFTSEAIDSFRQGFNSKLELLAEVDRDTLYFDGFEAISTEIKRYDRKILLSELSYSLMT